MKYIWARIRMWTHGMWGLIRFQAHRELVWSKGPAWKVKLGLAVCRVACADCHQVFWESDDPEWKDRDFDRASGDALCEMCGKKYYDHPFDETVKGWGDQPFLRLDCYGQRLKL